MTAQQKLDGYFMFTPEYSEHRHIFIYDPSNRRAYFDHAPRQTDKFVSMACNLKLYIRKSTTYYSALPLLHTTANSALVKSNLQKAVRRQQTNIAVASTAYLLQTNWVELLRRLPIIMVEDVCVTDALPILVWLMMACKEYVLSNEDKYIVLQIVNNLCSLSHIDNITEKENVEWTHTSVSNLVHPDICLSLFYRSKYGGMKCDMAMLNSAITHYSSEGREVVHTDWYLDLCLPHTLEIMREAIDYHPFPILLKQMSIKTGICETEIKHAIWTAESGVNLRKPYTLVVSEQYKTTNVWQILKYHLESFRVNMAQFDGFCLAGNV